MHPILVAAFLAAAGAAAPGPLPLELVGDIPLPGGATRFDYQWVDDARHRLYIAHLGADSLIVFDLHTQKVVGEVGGLPSVHGVVAAPERHLVFATITGQKKLALIDDETLAVRARVAAGEYPNGLAYDPKADKVFVSNNTGVGIAVVDVKHGRPLAGIDIGGGAGNTQYDAVSGHVFAAIHKVAALAEIDPAEGKLLKRHRLVGVRSCHGLLVAAAIRMAFAACGGDAGPKLVVFDLEQRRQRSVASIPARRERALALVAADPGARGAGRNHRGERQSRHHPCAHAAILRDRRRPEAAGVTLPQSLPGL